MYPTAPSPRNGDLDTLAASPSGSQGGESEGRGVVSEREPPCIAGRYEILGLLGTGGMGTVYRVRDRQLDEIVALKLVRSELLDSEENLFRFRQEVKLARKVTHRNVARTFDMGEHEGGLHLTMELVDGGSLGSCLEQGGPLPIERVVAIALDIAAGLDAAHGAGVIHRDLKPDNVLLASDGRAIITDFGIALALGGARGAGISGTLAYMAPEQIQGAADIDERADLYALGEVIYEMLTARRVWTSLSPTETLGVRLTSPPPDPRALRADTPAGLAALACGLMACRREDRPARAVEVTRALRSLGAGPALAPAAAPPRGRHDPGERRGKTVAVLPVGARTDEDHVADGVFEELVDSLSMVPGLRVRPGGMSARLRGLEAREIGRELGVQVVVELAVKIADGTGRVSARVISVEDGFQVWARRFQRPAAELLLVANEMAHEIAGALTTEFSAPDRDPDGDPLAVDLYLRARGELRAAWHESRRITRVADLFDAAIQRAPRDARVLSGGAVAHARVSFFGGPSAQGHIETARGLAERAIALAPQLGEAWVALATLRNDLGDAAGAARALCSGLGVAPRTAKAREMLGRLLLEAGEVHGAISHLTSSLALDPLAEEARWDLARAHAFLGDFAAASAVLAPPAETESGRVMRAYVSARLALWQPSLAPPSSFPDEFPGPDTVSRVATGTRSLLATRQRPTELVDFLEALARGAGRRIRPLALQTLAELDLAQANPDLAGALDHVLRSIDAGLADLAWMDLCPLLAPLRAAPAWPELRATVARRATPILDAASDQGGLHQ